MKKRNTIRIEKTPNKDRSDEEKNNVERKKFLVEVNQSNREFHSILATQRIVILLSLATLLATSLNSISGVFIETPTAPYRTELYISSLVLILGVLMVGTYAWGKPAFSDISSASRTHLQYKMFMNQLYPDIVQLSAEDKAKIEKMEIGKKNYY